MKREKERITCAVCGRVVARDKRTGLIARHGYRGGAGMGGGGCPTGGWSDMRAAVKGAIEDAHRLLEQKQKLIEDIDAGRADPAVRRHLVKYDIDNIRSYIEKLERILVKRFPPEGA